jgi:hypothetical protein
MVSIVDIRVMFFQHEKEERLYVSILHFELSWLNVT